MQDTDEIRVLVFHADPLVAVGVFTTFAQQAGFDPVPALAIATAPGAGVAIAIVLPLAADLGEARQ